MRAFRATKSFDLDGIRSGSGANPSTPSSRRKILRQQYLIVTEYHKLDAQGIRLLGIRGDYRGTVIPALRFLSR